MVGFGENPPTQPYHRASSCPDLPAPCTWADKAANHSNPQELTGAVVSGPNRYFFIISGGPLFNQKVWGRFCTGPLLFCPHG